jgi:hypothetical protein
MSISTLFMRNSQKYEMDGPPNCFKGKVVLSVSEIRKSYLPRHEDVQWSEDIAPPSLTSALGGGERSASRRCRFTGEETAPGTHCIR